METFPRSHRNALPILVTPASTCPSYRDVSSVELVVTHGRSGMKDDIICTTTKVRSVPKSND